MISFTGTNAFVKLSGNMKNARTGKEIGLRGCIKPGEILYGEYIVDKPWLKSSMEGKCVNNKKVENFYEVFEIS